MAKKKKNTKGAFILPVAILIIGLVGGIAIGTGGFQNLRDLVSGKNTEKIAQKTIDYINTQLGEGMQAELQEVSEAHGVYEVKFTIQDQETMAYTTKDGSLIFPSAIDTTATSTQPEREESAQAEIPKTEKPEVELFVMSFCPYGNRAENTIKPVYELLGDKVDWKIHYIVSEQGGNIQSLHGQIEVDQDARELCVLKNQGLASWFDFATYVNQNCGSKGECWEDGAKEVGLDLTTITSCADNQGTEMLTEEAAISKEKGASGSPTLLINGVKSRAVYQYGNSEAYKKEICSGFEAPPEECNETLAQSSGNPTSGGACQ